MSDLSDVIAGLLPPMPPVEALVKELMQMPYEKRHDYLRVMLDGIEDGTIAPGAITGNDYPAFFREAARRVAEEEAKQQEQPQ